MRKYKERGEAERKMERSEVKWSGGKVKKMDVWRENTI